MDDLILLEQVLEQQVAATTMCIRCSGRLSEGPVKDRAPQYLLFPTGPGIWQCVSIATEQGSLVEAVRRSPPQRVPRGASAVFADVNNVNVLDVTDYRRSSRPSSFRRKPHLKTTSLFVRVAP